MRSWRAVICGNLITLGKLCQYWSFSLTYGGQGLKLHSCGTSRYGAHKEYVIYGSNTNVIILRGCDLE